MSWSSRLRGTLRRGKLDDDLDEELRSHLEMRLADNMAAGMTPAEARYDAQKRFGNSTRLKEDTRETDIVYRCCRGSSTRRARRLLYPNASRHACRSDGGFAV